MITLRSTVLTWLKLLPENLEKLQRNSENSTNSLFRFYEREVEIGSKLLKSIRTDLKDIADVCEGTLKLTNHRRTLIAHITKGTIPEVWKKYPVPSSISINLWIVDFTKRIQQLQQLKTSKNYLTDKTWIGGLFRVDAYITATRQAAARSKGWSLENLVLVVDIAKDNNSTFQLDETSFVCVDLTLEGASWTDRLAISNQMSVVLPPTKFSWVEKSSIASSSTAVQVPLYLNNTRADLLTSIPMETTKEITASTWYQRGIACYVSSF